MAPAFLDRARRSGAMSVVRRYSAAVQAKICAIAWVVLRRVKEARLLRAVPSVEATVIAVIAVISVIATRWPNLAPPTLRKPA